MPDEHYDEVLIKDLRKTHGKQGQFKDQLSGILRCGDEMANSPFRVNSGLKMINR
jgi:hypothetical protein